MSIDDIVAETIARIFTSDEEQSFAKACYDVLPQNSGPEIARGHGWTTWRYLTQQQIVTAALPTMKEQFPRVNAALAFERQHSVLYRLWDEGHDELGVRVNVRNKQNSYCKTASRRTAE
jgi:predicted SAM-dependent methyltransferase